MSLQLNTENRDVIPNWRSFDTTLELGEIYTNSIPKKLTFDLDPLIEDWRENKNIGIAGDLISSFYIGQFELFPEIIEAIEFVNRNKNMSSNTLVDISNSIISSDVEILENKNLPSETEELLQKVKKIHTNYNHNLIKIYKEKAYKQKFNPINWVELSRLYSIEGHSTKAERAILNAISLAPENRFVLRSATRLFTHNKDPEKALFHLRRSKSTKLDPWLTSAHIAVSSHIGKFSPLRKEGIKQIESKKFSSFELSELNSSLGTTEYNEGSFKKSKDFFNNSIITPNDNSLAQFEFMNGKDDRFKTINPPNDYVKNNFEANALKYNYLGEWDKAFNFCLKWFIDMPFSIGPPELGSYIAALMGDFESGILLCEAGLVSNPHNLGLLNNLTYIYLQQDEIDKVENIIHIINNNRILITSSNPESKLTFKATLGLYLLKLGKVEDGIKLYQEAISEALKIKNKYCEAAALLNLTKELIKINYQDKQFYIEKCKKIKLEEYKDLQFIYSKFIGKYNPN